LKGVIADYRTTVLNAFGQVANALRAVQHDAQTLRYEQAAYTDSLKAYKLARWQYKAGAVQYTSLLTAQVQYEKSRLAVVSAKAQRFEDTAALFVAMGGGWWPKQYQSSAMASKKSASDVAKPAPGLVSRQSTAATQSGGPHR
ncbi:MAG: TolC family protein, partial [Phycisphaerae bacterium]